MHDTPIESVWTDVGEAAVEEPRWIVKNLIPEGMTIIGGPPKSYKSAVELAGVLTAVGVENAVLPPEFSEVGEPGKFIMLSMEAQPGVLRHTVEEGFGVVVPNDGRLRAMSDPWKFRLDQPRDVKELLEWAEYLDVLGLAIDPLRNCHSLDENDSGGMVMMLQPIQQWAIKNHKAVIIVHHAKKLSESKDGDKRMANANDFRGTSALFGMADAALTVTAKNNSGLIYVDAVFKRAEAWQRTIQLGLWGAETTESIDGQTKMVFELLVTGLSQDAIATALKLTKGDVRKAVAQLKRLGALDKDAQPTTNGAALVKGAVRKYSAAP